jgi:hypothetical protein
MGDASSSIPDGRGNVKKGQSRSDRASMKEFKKKLDALLEKQGWQKRAKRKRSRTED